MDLQDRFAALFAGYGKAYGTYEVVPDEQREDGKKKGRAATIKSEVTLALWHRHLSGESRLGIMPIREDNSVVFGAIDIDNYGIDHPSLAKKLDQLRLPLVPCKSKSGGMHAYLFTTEAVPAALMQRKLREAAAALGFGNSEIFPKQTEVLFSRGDLGSWINMPYFGKTCPAIRPDGVEMEVEEFLATADIKKLGKTELEAWTVKVKQDFADGPPCLQHLCTQGFPPGTRNMGLFNLGVYARKSNPDGWEKLLEDFNLKFMQPPLSANEVKEVVKSVKKKDYQYTCKSAPIVNHCNAAVCRGRRFGIGEHNGMPSLGSLTKYATNPPIWFLDIEGGGRLELSTEDLQMQGRFQRRCMDALNTMPPTMNANAWQSLMQNLLDNVMIVEAPKEGSVRGQLEVHLEAFCTTRPGQNKEDLLRGRPILLDGWYHFRLQDLVDYLERKKFKDFKVNQITSYLQNTMGAKHGFFNLKGKGINHWKLQGFTKQNESFDTPNEFRQAPY